MVLNVIIDVKPKRGEEDVFELLAQECGIDFTDVLQQALSNWDLFSERDIDLLRVKLETPLKEQMYYRRRRSLDRLSFTRFMYLLDALLKTTHAVHSELVDAIDGLSASRFGPDDVSYKLVGYTQRAAIIQITHAPRPI